MPWSVRKPSAAEIGPDWLKPYCEQFQEHLVTQGYAACTRATFDRAASALCAEIVRRKTGPDQLAGARLVKLREAALANLHANRRTYKAYRLDRFIEFLVEAGVAQCRKEKPRAPTALEHLSAEYATYLREQRGLSEATIYHCLRFLDRFITFRFGENLGNLNDITPVDVVAFLRDVMGRKPGFRDKTPPTHLRSLFRFLFWSGKTTKDLATSLPRVAAPKETHLARSLKPNEIERLLDAVWSSDPVGRRTMR